MIDVLYLCHGRKRFTSFTLPMLLKNTNWSLVNQLVVYNDAATDGHKTTKLLAKLLEDAPCNWTARETNLQSPVAVMNHFRHRSKTDLFAKIDNDIVLPPLWLERMSAVMATDPELELLGMEAGMSARKADSEPLVYTYTPSSHIGGVGLMRRDAFMSRPIPRPNGRFGFTEWQHQYQPVRGWIEPDLKMFALDQLPHEPWVDTTRDYIGKGLNRAWPKYPPEMAYYWEWAGV